MNYIRRILDRVMETASIVIFAAMVLLVAFQVFTRYVLNQPAAFTDTRTRYLFVWLVLITATYAFGKREHMCITFIKEKLPKRHIHRIDMAIELIDLVFSAAVMVFGGIRIASMQMVQLDSVLKIPMGVIYLIIPITGAGIMLYSLCNLNDDWNALRRGKEEA